MNFTLDCLNGYEIDCAFLTYFESCLTSLFVSYWVIEELMLMLLHRA